MLSTYRKAIGVVLVTVATFLVTVLTDGISPQEWVMIVGVGVSSIATAIVPNLDAGIGAIAKTVATAALGGLTVLATAILGGLTPTELAEVIVAALAAIGVSALPNGGGWLPATILDRNRTPVVPTQPDAGYPRI